MKTKIFITGITGFLGTEILNQIDLNRYEIFALSRKDQIHKDITFIKGDLSELNLGLTSSELDLILQAEIVLHLGAYYELEGAFSTCFMNNVAGTRNILNLFKKSKTLKEFHFISSIAIFDPNSNSHHLEESFPFRDEFSDHYSHSKYLSEKLFREYKFDQNISKLIYRPGIITAHALDAKQFKMDGPYYLAKFLKDNNQFFKFLPILPLSFKSDARIPIVSVDYVAKVILRSLDLEKTTKLKTYHLLTSNMIDLDILLKLMIRLFDINARVVQANVIKIPQKYLFSQLKIPSQIIPFMFHSNSYDTSCTNNDFYDIHCLSFDEYKDVFLNSLKNV